LVDDLQDNSGETFGGPGSQFYQPLYCLGDADDVSRSLKTLFDS
jgi:hypothetical protein